MGRRVFASGGSDDSERLRQTSIFENAVRRVSRPYVNRNNDPFAGGGRPDVVIAFATAQEGATAFI